jgi:hypothetical protein
MAISHFEEIYQQEVHKHNEALVRIRCEDNNDTSFCKYPFFWTDDTFIDTEYISTGDAKVKLFRKSNVALVDISKNNDLLNELGLDPSKWNQIWAVCDGNIIVWPIPIKIEVNRRDDFYGYITLIDIDSIIDVSSIKDIDVKNTLSNAKQAWEVFSRPYPDTSDLPIFKLTEIVLTADRMLPFALIKNKRLSIIRDFSSKERKFTIYAYGGFNNGTNENSKIYRNIISRVVSYKFDPKNKQIGIKISNP